MLKPATLCLPVLQEPKGVNLLEKREAKTCGRIIVSEHIWQYGDNVIK